MGKKFATTALLPPPSSNSSLLHLLLVQSSAQHCHNRRLHSRHCSRRHPAAGPSSSGCCRRRQRQPTNCPHQMGNLLNIRARHARTQMRNGIKLYQQQNPQQAIRQWRAALRKLKSAEDKFLTSGYIVQAFCDSGEFDQMLYAAIEQVDLANNQRDDFMKSEALLNLARANERLAEFEKAIGYAENSLALPGIDNRSPGYAHLVIALSQMGLSNFQQSLQQFEMAMKIAIETADKLLELQISLGLGHLFTLMRDLNKALIFLQNALGILHGIEANHVHAKYKSAILYQLSIILRLKERFSEAREVCEESIELAKKVGNKPIFARSLASLADICRELGETEARETVTKSWARYEQAFRLLRKINDRMGQILVLASMAKSANENKGVHYAGRCECQAIQLNRKCLELATIVGCKHAIMECQSRLQELYTQLADEENSEESSRAQFHLVQQMELFCNFCGQRYGDTDDSLQALNCSHIFHEKCLQKFFLRLGDGAPCICPKCSAKTGLMESISVSSSTAAQTPASESIVDFFCSVPSTSASAGVAPSASATNPPMVLCERNFDNTRWSSPTTVLVETAERQITLSTSTNSSFSVPTKYRRDKEQQQQQQPRNVGGDGLPPPPLSTFGQSQQQKRVNSVGNDEENEIQTMDMDEQQRRRYSDGDENVGPSIPIQQQNHVEMTATTNVGGSSGGGGGRTTATNGGGGRTKRGLLATMGKVPPISPVVEEAEEEDEEEEEAATKMMMMISGGAPSGRGVTEL